MSLLQRVTSLESLSPERGRSPAGSQRRKLSFSPLPGNWGDEVARPQKVVEELETVAAFDVSKAKRIVQVAIAVVYCLLAAGIVFGYAALKPVLIREGVYREYCTDDERRAGVRTCFEQEIHLNLMFTVAAVGTNVAALPIGSILDNFGPRVAGIIGSLFLAAGAALFAFAGELPFDAFIPGYLLLALGGAFFLITSYQLSNTFPKHSGLILALLTGAFDTSSALFLVYRILYQWSDGTFHIKRFFLMYLVVPAFILVAQIFIMPSQSYKTVGEMVQQVEDDDLFDDQMDETTALLREERRQRRASVVSEITELLGTKPGSRQVQQEERKNKISGVWGVLHGQTVAQQILSPWFILIALFTVIQMTRINFFVATIRPQYEYLLHSPRRAAEVNTFFDLALPLGGVLSIPFIGVILDHTRTPLVLGLLVALATTIGILGMLPSTGAAYAHITLFVLYRPFYYTAVSDYAAKVFGFRTFGTVYGLIICLAGMLNFSQSALDALLHRTFHGNPVPINAMLLASALLVGLVLCAFVAWNARAIERDGAALEAERAPEVAMPAAQTPPR